ncbi:glycosyltransferase family 1 protein [soil metagenome]
MNIGFDAKRAFHNDTGLGNYSRTLIKSLVQYYPENEYFLFNPKPSEKYRFNSPKIHEVLPQSFFTKIFSSAWRSKLVINDLPEYNLDLYHGLSHEIPAGINKTRIKSVVTIHDLIHERYPQQYNKIDVSIYHKKFLYACKNADRIIAVSEQTKNDIKEFYSISDEKIDVCYQSCDPSFSIKITEDEKNKAKEKYGLPDKFFLYVGSIIERKNLLTICKAMHALQNETSVPLVVIGTGDKYINEVKRFIEKKKLENRIIFLSEKFTGNSFYTELPAIYQCATALLYTSLFEGFGIPVLEALWSGLPVITSNTSCMPETGGDAALYVSATDFVDVADAMLRVISDDVLVEDMKQKGWLHAQKFTPQKCASSVMDVYKKLI